MILSIVEEYFEYVNAYTINDNSCKIIDIAPIIYFRKPISKIAIKYKAIHDIMNKYTEKSLSFLSAYLCIWSDGFFKNNVLIIRHVIPNKFNKIKPIPYPMSTASKNIIYDVIDISKPTTKETKNPINFFSGVKLEMKWSRLDFSSIFSYSSFFIINLIMN